MTQESGGRRLTASRHRGRPRGARTPDRSTLVRGVAISSIWDWIVAAGAQGPPIGARHPSTILADAPAARFLLHYLARPPTRRAWPPCLDNVGPATDRKTSVRAGSSGGTNAVADEPHRPSVGRSPAAAARATPHPGPSWLLGLSSVTLIGILTVVYFAAARFGLSLAAMHKSVSLVWPPTGIALAAVLLIGYRIWPGIALGAFLVNASAGVGLAVSAAIATGNTLRGAGRRLSSSTSHAVLASLSSGPRTSSVHCALAAGCLRWSAPPSASSASAWAGQPRGISSPRSGGSEWLGDAMGALIVGPVLLSWAARRKSPGPSGGSAGPGAAGLARGCQSDGVRWLAGGRRARMHHPGLRHLSLLDLGGDALQPSTGRDRDPSRIRDLRSGTPHERSVRSRAKLPRRTSSCCRSSWGWWR